MSTETKQPESVNTADAALIVGLSPATLTTRRSRGGGPPYHKLGKRVVYRVADLRAWMDERSATSTACYPVEAGA